MTFDIPDDIAAQVTDAVYGPGSCQESVRVEIVHMALAQFGNHCQLPAGHPAWHQGYLGSSELAWMDKANEVIPLPASIDTEATS